MTLLTAMLVWATAARLVRAGRRSVAGTRPQWGKEREP